MKRQPTTDPIAVIGYGHQGEAHALNLRESGRRVIVGARAEGMAASRARAAGFEVHSLEDAAAAAGLAALLLPDEILPERWPALKSRLPEGAALLFAHGYNLRFGELALPDSGDVVLVSPTGPGHVLRRARQRGETLPGYVAVHRDDSGQAWEIAETYARDAGVAPTLRTTVAAETEVDLFGEQAVLCGGMNALVTAAFETLVEAGYAPELAYLECVHQLRYLAEMLNERGLAGLREGISGTALFGDVSRGPRVIGAEARAAMRQLLEEVRSGQFAREWVAEAGAGRPRSRAGIAAARAHGLEAARRRALGGAPEGEGEDRATS